MSLITFTINGNEFQAEEGMAWYEWVHSDYNNMLDIYSFNCASTDSVVMITLVELGSTWVVALNNSACFGSDPIVNGGNYLSTTP